MSRTPIHPGEILADELNVLNIDSTQLSLKSGIPQEIIDDILDGKKDISPGIAEGLAKAFDTSAGMWIKLQDLYNTDVAMSLGISHE